MPDNFQEQPIQQDLFQRGYDNFGQNPLSFSGSEVNAKSSTYYEAGVPSNFIQDGDTIVRLNVIDGYLQSDGFITGSTGWQINSNGDAEFNSGVFRGSLSAGTIDIGGADTTSFHVDINGNVWAGAAAYADGVFKVSSAGALVATSASITGNLTIGTGNSVASGKTAYTDDTNAGFWLGNVTGTAKFNIGSSSTKYFHYDGTDITMLGGTITGGTIQTAATGYRLKLNGGNASLECLSNDTVLGYITISADGNIIIAADDDVYFYAGGAARAHVGTDGIYSEADIQCGDVFKSSDGSSGLNDTVTVVTYVGYDPKPPGVGNYRRTRVLTFKDGIITDIGAQSDMIAW